MGSIVLLVVGGGLGRRARTTAAALPRREPPQLVGQRLPFPALQPAARAAVARGERALDGPPAGPLDAHPSGRRGRPPLRSGLGSNHTAQPAPPARTTSRDATRGHEPTARPRRHAERPERAPVVMRNGRPVLDAAEIKRRRTKVLYLIAGTAGVSGLMAATTDSKAMVYLFAVAVVALGAYVYLLAIANQQSLVDDPDYADERDARDLYEAPPASRRSYRYDDDSDAYFGADTRALGRDRDDSAAYRSTARSVEPSAGRRHAATTRRAWAPRVASPTGVARRRSRLAPTPTASRPTTVPSPCVARRRATAVTPRVSTRRCSGRVSRSPCAAATSRRPADRARRWSRRTRYTRVVLGAVAQLVERDNRTVEARGSIPLSSTRSLARGLAPSWSSAPPFFASGGRSGATEACPARAAAPPEPLSGHSSFSISRMWVTRSGHPTVGGELPGQMASRVAVSGPAMPSTVSPLISWN